jgi:hypothetical protein
MEEEVKKETERVRVEEAEMRGRNARVPREGLKR